MMDEQMIYNELETLRSRYEVNPESLKLPITESIIIDGKVLQKDIWSESYQNEEIIVFMFETKSPIVTSAYCLGIKVDVNGNQIHLSNEELWGIGIP